MYDLYMRIYNTKFNCKRQELLRKFGNKYFLSIVKIIPEDCLLFLKGVFTFFLCGTYVKSPLSNIPPERIFLGGHPFGLGVQKRVAAENQKVDFLPNLAVLRLYSSYTMFQNFSCTYFCAYTLKR